MAKEDLMNKLREKLTKPNCQIKTTKAPFVKNCTLCIKGARLVEFFSAGDASGYHVHATSLFKPALMAPSSKGNTHKQAKLPHGLFI